MTGISNKSGLDSADSLSEKSSVFMHECASGHGSATVEEHEQTLKYVGELCSSYDSADINR